VISTQKQPSCKKKSCGPVQNGQGEKSCEIKGDSQGMAVMVYVDGKNLNETRLEKTRLPTHNSIKLTISPEMDYWLNTLSYSTVCLTPKS